MANLMAKLEELEDQELAIKLLKKFNDKTAELGQLIMNQDEKLDHENWKNKCDNLKKEVDQIVTEIMSQ
jgi:hypothetical protein